MLQKKLYKYFCPQHLFGIVFHIFDWFGKILTLKAFQWAIVGFCGTYESRFTSILLQNFILQNPQICKKESSDSFIANFEDVILKFFDRFRLSVPLWKALTYVNLELQWQRQGSWFSVLYRCMNDPYFTS